MLDPYNDYQSKNKTEYFLELKAGPPMVDCFGEQWRAVCHQDKPLSRREAFVELKRCRKSKSAQRGWLFRVRRVETRTQIVKPNKATSGK